MKNQKQSGSGGRRWPDVADLEYRVHAFFVAASWVFNALEKFGLVGLARREQIAGYLMAFGLGDGLAQALTPVTLGFFGLIEGAATVCAALALIRGRGGRYLRLAICLSVMMFGIFVAGDVLAGNREQFMKHTVYATLFLIQGGVLGLREWVGSRNRGGSRGWRKAGTNVTGSRNAGPVVGAGLSSE